MPDFRFDEDEHQYTLDGEVLVGVSETLVDVGLMDYYPPNPFYLERGIAVHEACNLYLFGRLDEESVDPIVKPHLEGFKAFLSQHAFTPDEWLCEVPQYHPDWLYAGRPDLVGRLNGRRAVIDIQSGGLGKSKAIQTAAYAEFPNLQPIDARFGLSLPTDGSYKLVEFKERSDFDIWRAALTIYRAKRR